jgi:hypothetical protein
MASADTSASELEAKETKNPDPIEIARAGFAQSPHLTHEKEFIFQSRDF